MMAVLRGLVFLYGKKESRFVHLNIKGSVSFFKDLAFDTKVCRN